jgi:hypothetical protein
VSRQLRRPRLCTDRTIGIFNCGYRKPKREWVPEGARLTVLIHPRDSNFVLDSHRNGETSF